MLKKDFNHMKRYYNLISLASIKEQHPNVPWRGYLFGYVFVKENGDIYDGEWRVFKSRSVLNGRYMFHGEGIYYFGSLDQYYVGPLEVSQCQGVGRYIWVKSGEVWTNNFDPAPGAPFKGFPFDYHGDVVYEVKHGQATITFKNGQTLQTTWDHGKIIYPTNAYTTSPTQPSPDTTVENPIQQRGKRKSSTSSSTSAKRNNTTTSTTADSSNLTSSPTTNKEVAGRLRELKNLYEENLITQQVYHEAQGKIINDAIK